MKNKNFQILLDLRPSELYLLAAFCRGEGQLAGVALPHARLLLEGGDVSVRQSVKV